ncbi:MAG: hypothetical protein RBT59_13865, partial [Arcobacteraceae bacterium]|nr:hypothetical protein [Arcobacteraceae bacterium]
KYFSDKGLELYTIDERSETLRKILSKKKGYVFNELIAKNKKPYDAKIFTELTTDRSGQKRWGFSLSFVNSRK